MFTFNQKSGDVPLFFVSSAGICHAKIIESEAEAALPAENPAGGNRRGAFPQFPAAH